MIDPDIQGVIEALSYQYKLPPNLVRAICEVESSWNVWAFRHEPAYRWIMGERASMTITERFGQMSSWGLMQIMGAVAREYGWTGPFPQLCEPAIGVNYGCKHLQNYYLRYDNWDDAIASYNAGSPRKIGQGYHNQAYVTKVKAAWAKLGHPPQA